MVGSTCEAEYIAASEAANEGVWMKEFISDLGVIPSASGPMKIICDNTGAIPLAKESRFHKRTKHIKIRMHYIRELIHDWFVSLQYCPIAQQVADIFTKSFTENKFSELRAMIGVVEIAE